MVARTAPIFNLLLPSSPANPTQNPNSQTPVDALVPPQPRHHLSRNPPLLTSRRHLLLLSLPISLFPSSPSALASLDLATPAEREASAAVSRRVDEAVELLDKGRELQARGDFTQALEFFTQVIESYKDLALSDYARVGRALALYEVGNREDAITEMEDVSISLKGYPEVHAALAAALYVDKHAPLLAENQFTIATLLDPHYTDISYVRETKHWPPSLISSLQDFITLS